MSKAVIAVVGSAMMDLTAYARVLPESGQTLLGELFTTGFGGKGANQAVIAAKCGAEVHFIGALGRDLFGDSIAKNFQDQGINVDGVERSDVPTGVAHIWVDARGENRIIIIPGANYELKIANAVRAVLAITNLSVVLAQCEIKQEVTRAVFIAAKERGAITILNPAPFEPLSDELLELTDWIIPNESEFKSLTNTEPYEDRFLVGFRPGKNSIITLGEQGAVFINVNGDIVRLPAPKTTAVDTTGAGDAFVGSFAYGLASAMPPTTAIALAIQVASMSVTKKGAQSSYPTQAEIATLS